MSEQPFVIAVDGPAGSGKSSVSRGAARELGYGYVDTGAAYRALTWKILDAGTDAADPEAVARTLPEFRLSLSTDPDHFFVRVDGTDVTDAIREPWVTSEVRLVSRVPDVRRHLTYLFRDAVRSSGRPGVVVEGRDITTNVAPDAPVRVLLTADESVRMARRSAELDGAHAREAGAQLLQRDRADSMVTDFMTASDGVITLDSTSLDLAGTVDALIAIAAAHGAPGTSDRIPATGKQSVHG